MMKKKKKKLKWRWKWEEKIKHWNEVNEFIYGQWFDGAKTIE